VSPLPAPLPNRHGDSTLRTGFTWLAARACSSLAPYLRLERRLLGQASSPSPIHMSIQTRLARHAAAPPPSHAPCDVACRWCKHLGSTCISLPPAPDHTSTSDHAVPLNWHLQILQATAGIAFPPPFYSAAAHCKARHLIAVSSLSRCWRVRHHRKSTPAVHQQRRRGSARRRAPFNQQICSCGYCFGRYALCS
jgi:hypothetical protein